MGNKNMESEENTVANEELENHTEDHREDENPEAVNEKDIEETETETEEKKDSIEEQYSELNNKYVRLYSEFDNYRRRTAKERLELIQQANASLLTDLISVLDDFDRAIKSNESAEDIEVVKEGVKLVHHKFHHILESKGLKCMDSSEKEFNLDHHEAITKIPVENKKDKGKVVDVIEKGYFLHDKVIRYAKVVIGE